MPEVICDGLEGQPLLEQTLSTGIAEDMRAQAWRLHLCQAGIFLDALAQGAGPTQGGHRGFHGEEDLPIGAGRTYLPQVDEEGFADRRGQGIDGVVAGLAPADVELLPSPID